MGRLPRQSGGAPHENHENVGSLFPSVARKPLRLVPRFVKLQVEPAA